MGRENNEFKNLIKDETPKGNTQEHSNEDVGFTQKLKGLIAELGWITVGIASICSVQLLERRIPDFELNMFRYAESLVIFSLFLLLKREWPAIPRTEILSTFGFSMISVFHSVCLFVAVTFVPVSSVQAIYLSSNVLSGMILFALFWKEKISLSRLFFGLLCSCGVLLVIQPEFIFTKKSGVDSGIKNSNRNETIGTMAIDTPQEKETSKFLVALGYTLPVINGLGISLNTLLNKKHPYLNENMLPVLFWSFVLGTTISAVAMAIFESPVLPGTWYDFTLIIVHCSTFIVTWPCCLYATRYVSGNTINIVYCSSLVFLLVCQYTILSSILPGNRNWMEVVGVVLVLLGTSMGSVLELIRKD